MKQLFKLFSAIVFLLYFPFLALHTEAQDALSIAQRRPAIVSLTINQDHPGIRIPDNFAGFSYELSSIIAPNYLSEDNKVLVRLIQNLGNGILRVGGNSSDKINWTGYTRNLTTSKDSLTKTDIDRFAAFAKKTGWKVLFGVNLGSKNVSAAADEAWYAKRSFNDMLYLLQIGNEPDLYYKWTRPKDYNYEDYQNDWKTYFSAIKKSVPSIAFAGPAMSNNIDWTRRFSKNMCKDVELITAHYYRKMGDHTTTEWPYILEPDGRLTDYLKTLDSSSAALHLPYRISECNSVSRGGKAGVSDVFAAALWTLDFMWTVAGNNGQGVNFHGGSTSHYAPIVLKNGIPVPRPGYYGMLAFKYGSGSGKILPVNINQSIPRNYSVYACLDGNNTLVTLINKDSVDIQFSIHLGNKASQFQIARLTAPSVSASDGLSFANNTVKPDGSYRMGKMETYTINDKVFDVHIPAFSAAVVVIE